MNVYGNTYINMYMNMYTSMNMDSCVPEAWPTNLSSPMCRGIFLDLIRLLISWSPPPATLAPSPGTSLPLDTARGAQELIRGHTACPASGLDCGSLSSRKALPGPRPAPGLTVGPQLVPPQCPPSSGSTSLGIQCDWLRLPHRAVHSVRELWFPSITAFPAPPNTCRGHPSEPAQRPPTWVPHGLPI